MCSLDVIDLYKKGYSIDFIINKYYEMSKAENKIIKFTNKNILLINNIRKNEIRGKVYKIIFNYNKKLGVSKQPD